MLYPSRTFGKLNGRKKCGRKRCTSNRDNRSLERIVKRSPFKNLGEIHKEWTAAGVSASRATTHRRVQDIGFNCRIPCVKPLLNQRQHQRHLTWDKDKKDWTVAQWSKVLFSDESTFCISFGNQGPTLLEVQCKVSTVSHGLGCHVICWCLSTVFSEVQGQRSRTPGSLRAVHASCC